MLRAHLLRFGAALIALLLSLPGCSGNDTVPSTAAEADAGGCKLGERASDAGACIAAGLPTDMPCPPGEYTGDAGGCEEAGVPPDGCGEGFMSDGQHGCEAILPAATCAVGQFAVPGQTSCHEVASCGNGTWGDIPVEANTQYVDAAYMGGGSNGSASKPWTTVTNAIGAAANGAIVAIAAGSYAEALDLDEKPVRLWGRCPSMVEIASTDGNEASIFVEHQTLAVEVHDLAVTGASSGVLVTGSKSVLLDRLWIHDTQSAGVALIDDLGPSTITMTGSLVEKAYGRGVILYGGTISLDSCSVRSTIADSPNGGIGISIAEGPATRSTATLSACVVENNYAIGVNVEGSDVTIERTVVRKTAQGGSVSPVGFRLSQSTTGAVATGAIHTSIIEDNGTGIVTQAAALTIDTTVVRDNASDKQGATGSGILSQSTKTAASTLTLGRSLVAHNQGSAIQITGSEGHIESTLISDTQADIKDSTGRGIEVEPAPPFPGKLTLTTSVIEDSTAGGVVLLGATASIESTIVRRTVSGPKHLGEGIIVQAVCTSMGCDASQMSDVTIHATQVEAGTIAGILVTLSKATVDACLVSDTKDDGQGLFGDGIAVDLGQLSMTSTRVENSARAGLSSFGGDVTLSGSLFACQVFDLDGESEQATAYAFHDDGGNGCGCAGASEPCKAKSSMLAPPPAIAGLE